MTSAQSLVASTELYFRSTGLLSLISVAVHRLSQKSYFPLLSIHHMQNKLFYQIVSNLKTGMMSPLALLAQSHS